MLKWLKRRREAVFDEVFRYILGILIAAFVTSFIGASIIAGSAALALMIWAVVASPTAPNVVLIGIGAFVATFVGVRQLSAAILEWRQKKLMPQDKASRYITPSLEDDFVLSSGVAWYWDGANMDGPLCPLRGHVIALDYEPREEVRPGRLSPPTVFGQTEETVAGGLKPPIPSFSFEDAVQGLGQEERRAPLEDDRVGLGVGKLVCPKGEEIYMLDSFDLSGRGKMIGEARKLAFKEYQAKIRRRKLTDSSSRCSGA